MTPDQYCEAKVAESKSNLVSAFRILSADRRRAITALYAFCREVDDVVDECKDPGISLAKLAWWSAETGRLFESSPTHPVTLALLPHLGVYSLKQEHFAEIIAGVQTDLAQSRFSDFEDLDRYCDRVAGAVGLCSARIFGEVTPQTDRYALLLGRALQYTNILRDIGEDARRGRIYLPIELLSAHQVEPASILRLEHTNALTHALGDMAASAERLFDQALDVLPQSQRAEQRPGLIMAAIYRDLLRLLISESFDVMNQRISVAPARKVWLAWKTAIGYMPR